MARKLGSCHRAPRSLPSLRPLHSPPVSGLPHAISLGSQQVPHDLAPAPPCAFQDRTCEVVEDAESGRMVKKMKKRICLVLDCLCAHDFSDKTADLINLQHYVIKEKRLSERETVVIFYDVVRVVEALHQVSSHGLGTSPTGRGGGSRGTVGLHLSLFVAGLGQPMPRAGCCAQAAGSGPQNWAVPPQCAPRWTVSEEQREGRS